MWFMLVSDVFTCRGGCVWEVGELCELYKRAVLLLWSWCGGVLFCHLGFFSRASKILLGAIVCSSFKFLLFVNSA